MSEMSAEPETAVAADTNSLDASKFTYCGECGTWGAHGASCATCGYTFIPAPWPQAPSIDDPEKAASSFG